MHTELDLRNITIQTRLFKIFGIWPQTDIHNTHVRNAVTLVWGSLRLAQARPNYTYQRSSLPLFLWMSLEMKLPDTM